MIIYNAGNIDHNKRFILSILIGTTAAVGLGLAYGAVQRMLHIEMEIVYIFIGWCIARLLQNVGHGVTMKYSVLGAVLTVIAIVVGDLAAGFGFAGMISVLVHPSFWLSAVQMIIITKLSSIWGILGIVFRAAGVYTAYTGSRIF